jgi:hypothetical protein
LWLLITAAQHASLQPKTTTALPTTHTAYTKPHKAVCIYPDAADLPCPAQAATYIPNPNRACLPGGGPVQVGPVKPVPSQLQVLFPEHVPLFLHKPGVHTV